MSDELCQAEYRNMIVAASAPPVLPAKGNGQTPSTPAPTNRSIKSPARQECEANAQQQFDATRTALNRGFWGQMKSGAGEGFVGGLIGGCLFTSEVGCFEGAIPAAAVGAVSGASISTYHYIWNNGPQMTAARRQYEQQMQACMFL